MQTILPQFNLTPYLNFLIHYFTVLDYRVALHQLIIFILSFFALYALSALLFKLLRYFYHRHELSVFLEITPPQTTEVLPFTTAQLFNIISDLLSGRSFADKLTLKQNTCSFEIVSQKETGIRYLLRVPKRLASMLEKNLRSYLPGLRIKEAEDYLPDDIASMANANVLEFKLASHFSLPLNMQVELEKHDPLAYLTGHMTQLETENILAVQIILRPINGLDQSGVRREINRMKLAIHHNKFAELSHEAGVRRAVYILAGLLDSAVRVLMIPLLFVAEFMTGNEPEMLDRSAVKSSEPTPAETERESLVKSKLDNPLYEATVRAYLDVSKNNMAERISGLAASFTSFTHVSGQAIAIKWSPKFLQTWRLKQFKVRMSGTPLYLTSSEVGALYHFPFTRNSQTEDLIRVKSKELPAPLALKNNYDLDVVFGKNNYGNVVTEIGLTDDDRSRHVYLIGQTGSGKSTIIYHMASDDIQKGRGVAVIDPHGDLAEGLLHTVPESRLDDLIYFNPFDVKYPVGINLLELTPYEDEDDLELEKELVCESVISIFRRVFSKDENSDAHRIEYILRNTIYTAFIVPDCTIFTVYDLLNDPQFQKSVVRRLRDENLINFWKNEFGKAGNFQIVKMVGGVTARVGRFLFSPTAKRILEQPHSTIKFDDIVDSGKILICNLAEGKIGEDTSQLLGTTIIAKIQQAMVRRARIETTKRKSFYLFVDEFQNFATKSFNKLLSGGRKFGLHITIAEQSTSQQDDRNAVNVILANTGTMICFRTASPVDEDLMLAQFAPAVARGDIGNLPRYRFYIRLAAVEPQEPFSGETIPILTSQDPDKFARLIKASRKNYAIEYIKPAKLTIAPTIETKPKIAGPKKTEGEVTKTTSQLTNG